MEKIIAKAMNYKQYKDFLKLKESVNEKGKKEKLSNENQTLLLADWVVKEVYDIDPDTTQNTFGTIVDLTNKTIILSNQSEVEDLKNLEKSGTGE